MVYINKKTNQRIYANIVTKHNKTGLLLQSASPNTYITGRDKQKLTSRFFYPDHWGFKYLDKHGFVVFHG